MAFLPMMKFLVSPEHPQSSTGAMGDAGFWTGEPDVQASLAPQDAERAPGSVGSQEKEWVIGCAARSWGASCPLDPLQANLALVQCRREPGCSFPIFVWVWHPLSSSEVRGLHPWVEAGLVKSC